MSKCPKKSTPCAKKAADYGLSELEFKIICDQIARRQEYRKEFLRARTDPCAHSKEAGYVFDPAIQKFLSMKVSLLDTWSPNFRSIRFGVCGVLLPMLVYGAAIWTQRTNLERERRCGRLRYRDRIHKLA